LTCPFGKFLQWSQHYAEWSINEAQKRNVEMRIITEQQLLKMLATSEIFSPSLTAKLGYINFKYTQNPISVELMIFDKKTLFISTKEESNLNKMRWLCTNNPFIVEMANSYFENLWSTATKETEDNPLCRKNNNSACAPKKHPYPRLAMHNRHATRSFNSHKTRKARTNKGNNKAYIKLTRKHQFSNTLARENRAKETQPTTKLTIQTANAPLRIQNHKQQLNVKST